MKDLENTPDQSPPLQPGERPLLIVIIGPTAVGKTSLAIGLAKWLGCEILNADSRQVYRKMVIGTAQPTPEERAAVPHHLIDFLEPNDLYSAGQYGTDALRWLESWFANHRTAVMVGGSGLYIKAVLEGLDDVPADVKIRLELKKRLEAQGLDVLLEELKALDPAHYAKMDQSNPQRVVRALEVCLTSGRPFSSFHRHQPVQRPFDICVIGLEMSRDLLRERIDSRVLDMIASGMEEEAKTLHPLGHLNALQTVGYREWFDYFDGYISKEKAISAIQTHTRQFAKRQMTWFQRMEHVRWFDANNRMAVFEFLSNTCAQRGWGSERNQNLNDTLN